MGIGSPIITAMDDIDHRRSQAPRAALEAQIGEWNVNEIETIPAAAIEQEILFSTQDEITASNILDSYNNQQKPPSAYDIVAPLPVPEVVPEESQKKRKFDLGDKILVGIGAVSIAYGEVAGTMSHNKSQFGKVAMEAGALAALCLIEKKSHAVRNYVQSRRRKPS